MGTRLTISRVPKFSFWVNFPPKSVRKPSRPKYAWRIGADPAFHETIVITVPLGLTGSKTSFFAWRCAQFQFVLVFRCVFCYSLSYHFFFQNQQLFKKNAPSLNNFVFATVHLRVCYFFASFHVSVDLLILVGAPPWPKMGRKIFNYRSIQIVPPRTGLITNYRMLVMLVTNTSHLHN